MSGSLPVTVEQIPRIYSVRRDQQAGMWATGRPESSEVRAVPLVVEPSVDHELWHLPTAPLYTQTLWMVHAVRALYVVIVAALWMLTSALWVMELWVAVAVLAPILTACSILLLRTGGSQMRTHAAALATHEGFTTELLRVDSRGVRHGGTSIRWADLILSCTQLSNCCMVELRDEHEQILLPLALEPEAVRRMLCELGRRRRQAVGAQSPVDERALRTLTDMLDRPI